MFACVLLVFICVLLVFICVHLCCSFMFLLVWCFRLNRVYDLKVDHLSGICVSLSDSERHSAAQSFGDWSICFGAQPGSHRS